jgi:hypothetical protein
MGIGTVVAVSVVDFGVPGNSCGTLRLTGSITSFVVGGQELWIDDLSVDSVDFVRTDSNDDSRVDLTDVIFILDYMFLGGPCPRCLDAADADDNGKLEITDPIYILNWLFRGGPSPPPPTPVFLPSSGSAYDKLVSCGPDPSTVDELWCPEFKSCP